MLCIIKIPYVKIQIFRDRSFAWFLNYFFAKFLEILTTGSVRNRQVSAKAIGLNFSSNCACAAFNWVFSIWENPKLPGSLCRYLF